MNLKQYQKEALKTAIYPNIGSNWFYPAISLGGEVGEVLNKLSKIIRDDIKLNDTTFQDSIHYELGDLMWYFVMLCYELKIDPDLVLELNINKLRKRKETKTISGSGDHREVPLGL